MKQWSTDSQVSIPFYSSLGKQALLELAFDSSTFRLIWEKIPLPGQTISAPPHSIKITSSSSEVIQQRHQLSLHQNRPANCLLSALSFPSSQTGTLLQIALWHQLLFQTPSSHTTSHCYIKCLSWPIGHSLCVWFDDSGGTHTITLCSLACPPAPLFLSLGSFLALRNSAWWLHRVDFLVAYESPLLSTVCISHHTPCPTSLHRQWPLWLIQRVMPYTPFCLGGLVMPGCSWLLLKSLAWKGTKNRWSTAFMVYYDIPVLDGP